MSDRAMLFPVFLFVGLCISSFIPTRPLSYRELLAFGSGWFLGVALAVAAFFTKKTANREGNYK